MAVTTNIGTIEVYLKPVLAIMRSFSVTLCVILVLSICKSNACKCDDCCCSVPSPDYYWRPYEGVIPQDAVKGGLRSNNITFIGQIPAKTSAGVIPANIYPGQRAAEGTYGGTFRNDGYVKILCSPRKDKIEWRHTTVDDLHLLTDFHLIVGGYEIVDRNLWRVYIGRINYDNDIIMGKVFKANSAYKGLRIPAPDGEEVVYNTFEILVYSR